MNDKRMMQNLQEPTRTMGRVNVLLSNCKDEERYFEHWICAVMLEQLLL
jgi:hypothetical protein